MALCKKAWPKIKKLLSCIDDFLLKNVDRALAISTALKNILASKEAAVVTDLIPGHWDNFARVAAISALEVALRKLELVKDSLHSEEFEKFRLWLKGQPKYIQDSLLHKISALIAQNLDNARFSQSLYDTFVQARYVEQNKEV